MTQLTTHYPLPHDFNPDTLMQAKETEYGRFHEVRKAARLAATLVENGAPEDIALAEQILKRVLACQEMNPDDPHFGNFYWMAEDDHVEDLNAVEFVLETLIPMMMRHAQRLTEPLQTRLLEAIRLGLAEIARLDVLVAYTNITALDILNTCLGGELLQDAAIAQRGYAKLEAWVAYTNLSGHPLEYNSPTYGAVTLRALKRLADLVQDPATQRVARAMSARLGLSVALHLHAGTGRWAGPHGRAYQPTVVCETRPEIEMLHEWLADGTLPGWIADLLDHLPAHFQVVETAERSRELAITTYQSTAYALGTASQSFHGQANVCMMHYARPDAPRPGVLYTRYILDDKWFGDAYHATDRTKTRNLPDEGQFFSVQDGNRAIGLYAPTGHNHFASAKTVLIWTEHDQIDELWVNGDPVTDLPFSIPTDATLVIGSGDVYTAMRPLRLSPIGSEAPMQLVERDGDLVLELFNYRGPDKRFWELNWPGAFFKGWPFCAFYLEVDDRAEFSDGRAFAEAIASGVFDQHLDEPFTYPAEGERRYRASYSRAGRELGLEVDTMQWRLLQRWTHDGDPGWPMLESGIARQVQGGRVAAGDASAESDAGPLWLVSLPQAEQWVAGYLGQTPTTMRLTTPLGVREVELGGPDVVEWGREGAQDW